jgi:hypothetical protein
MSRLLRASTLLALVGVAFWLLTPNVASAHERRTVAGDYTFVVGFLVEPAFEGEVNGIDLRITKGADNAPVEGAENTLKAEVTYGGSTMPVELSPRFRQPGAYNGDFVPTRSGAYQFRFSGTLDGRPVDERFESGPGRFSDIQAIAPLQFPEKVASASELQRALTTAESRAAAADSRANLATVLGALGLGAGLLGLLLAVWALTRSRAAARPAVSASTRPASPAPAAPPERL